MDINRFLACVTGWVAAGRWLRTVSFSCLSLTGLGFTGIAGLVHAQSLNPSVSPAGAVLLQPPSKAGPQAFNPSMAPESRVLLAPVPKAAAQRAEAQAKEKARRAAEANRPRETRSQGTGRAGAAGPSASGPVDYEARLAAIRTELIDAASRAQVRVKSLSWVDDQGQLHEANEFRSDAKVRGIRVNRYLGESRVEIDEVSPSSATEDCTPKPSSFKRHAYFSVRAEQGGAFFSSGQLSVLAQELGPEILTVLAAETGWAFSQSPYGDGQSRPGSLYEDRLLSRIEDSAPYALSVRLVDMGRFSGPPAQVDPLPDRPPPPPAWMVRAAQKISGEPPPPELGMLGLVLVMSDRQSGATLFSRAVQLKMRMVRPGYLDAPRAVVADMAQAQQALMSLQHGLRVGMGCVAPEYPVLDRQPEGRFQLNAGSRHGLVSGHQVLLAAPSSLPTRVLQPEVASSLALAVVESVDPYRAVVRLVAGPAPSASSRVVGIPF